MAVSDDDILIAQRRLAQREGSFICPEGAATISAAIKLLEEGWITSQERILLLNTGAGLKYPETVQADPPVLEPDGQLPNVG